MAQNERPPLVVPILLIVVGALFLYANYQPAFDPWPILRTYWPLFLIFVGLGKMWDYSQRRNNPSAPPGASVGSIIAIVAVTLVLALLIWHGHTSSHHRWSSSLRHEVRSVDLQSAQSVRASLETSVGDLVVNGGSSRLLDADFSFNDSFASPKVNYSVASGVGLLEVIQDDQSTHFGTTHNTWNLRLSNNVPMELKVQMGAGEGRFRLRDVQLTRFDLEVGAGHVDVDLSGDRNKDLNADIQGGVGQATIRLPQNVGVVVHASGGIGAVDTHGLKHEGDEYTNDAYGKTPATVRLNVQGGVGAISLLVQP
jgi:N-terminal domain of toast_rack, DUF2154/Domain of unknown function (DUF5668)